jgi:hypothetical protein
MIQHLRSIEYDPALVTEEQRTVARVVYALVRDPSKLGNLGASEPEVGLANIVCAALKQPSKFFRLMTASYRVTGGSDETRDRFVKWATASPYFAGADVLLSNIWNALWQRDLNEDDIDVLRNMPIPWLY